MTGPAGRAVLTPDLTARAIVAACMLLGVSPEAAFEPTVRKGKQLGTHGSGSARVLAAHALRARLGIAPTALGRVLKVHPNTLAPSQRGRYGITTDMLLAISEALGPIADDDARGRFLEPMSGVPTNPKPEARSPRPEARSPKPEARSPKPEARSPKPEARSPKPEARSPKPEAARWAA